MIKIRNKRIALLLVIAMMATMFIGVGTASAATTYDATSAPTVAADSTSNLGSIVVEIDTFSGAASALISLPDDFEYNTTSITPSVLVDGGTAPTASFTIASASSNEGTLTLSNTTATGLKVVIPLAGITVPSGADDDIIAEITGLTGQLSSGTVVVGHTGTGDVGVTTGTPPAITSAGTTGGKIKLTLKETAASGLAQATESVKFTLPYGFTWTNVGATADPLAGLDTVTAAVSGSDPRVLVVTVVNHSPASKGVYRISADIAVDELKAKYGDVDVRISGKSDVSVSSLVVATYGDYSVTASVEDETTILAGRMGEEVGDIVFTEAAPESAVDGRSFTLTLPEGAKWVDWNTSSAKGFDGDVSLLGTNGRTLKVVVDQTNSGSAGTFTLKDIEVDTAVDFSGPLTATIDGKAGIDTASVTIATVQAPVTVTGTKADVKIGLPNQLAGQIVITEVEAGAIMGDKDLLIKVSDDAVEITDADVEVTAGDLVLSDSSSWDFTNEVLTIPIEGESRTASTITVSNIKLKVDRTVVEGTLDAKVAGSAVDEFADDEKIDDITSNTNNDYRTTPADPDKIKLSSYDLFGSTAGKATFANVVTPAPGEQANTAVFTFGSPTYTINGATKNLLAPIFAQNNRTYLPIRDIAYALGINDNNIIWDQASQTVTLIQSGKVVQVKLGSNIMTINSVPVTLDVTVLAQDGRTYLPAAWIANAFGASATWDAAANTVTINY
ncbi:MAG: stalk domain-containing protein [Syntrophomonadaceae bacterium]|nr:stalk domain-containing protein [Syntrophomonadaceae bacterium]